MLQVDLQDPNEKIRQFVNDQCSKHGEVVSIEIHRAPNPFALVEMAHHLQTLELAGQFGGSAFGTAALIHLEQKP